MSGPGCIVGKVVGDADGCPVPGAWVFVKNGAEEVFTDAQGRYAIETAALDTLVFRHPAFRERQVRAAGRGRIDLQLKIKN